MPVNKYVPKVHKKPTFVYHILNCLIIIITPLIAIYINPKGDADEEFVTILYFIFIYAAAFMFFIDDLAWWLILCFAGSFWGVMLTNGATIGLIQLASKEMVIHILKEMSFPLLLSVAASIILGVICRVAAKYIKPYL
jgi:hypothetical protein